MSKQVEGFVAKIFSKDFPRRGGGTGRAYSFKIELASGEELNQFFRFGFKEPPFKEGEYIRFQADDKDENSATVVEGSGEFVKNAPARASAAAPQQSAAASRGGKAPYAGRSGAKDAYWADKEARDVKVTQPRIQYQNARTAAIQAVGMLLGNDGLPAAKAATKAGQAARFDAIVAAVNKLTVQFYNDTESLRLLSSVADAGVEAPQLEKDAELPESEPLDSGVATQLGEDEPDVDDVVPQTETADQRPRF